MLEHLASVVSFSLKLAHWSLGHAATWNLLETLKFLNVELTGYRRDLNSVRLFGLTMEYGGSTPLLNFAERRKVRKKTTSSVAKMLPTSPGSYEGQDGGQAAVNQSAVKPAHSKDCYAII